MNQQLSQPVLQIQGQDDSCLLPSTAADSRRYVEGILDQHVLTKVGHFPHVEAKEQVTPLLLDWARGQVATGVPGS